MPVFIICFLELRLGELSRVLSEGLSVPHLLMLLPTAACLFAQVWEFVRGGA